MLISHDKKFIFTKTYKTGGTSIESYFERHCWPPDLEYKRSHLCDGYESSRGVVGWRGKKRPSDALWVNHMSAHLIKRNIGDSIWNEYFKFCSIRNPFEIAVSAYFWQLSKVTHLGRVPPLLSSLRTDFQKWLEDNTQIANHRNKYVIDGRLCVDAVVRYENMESDLEGICRTLQIDWHPDTFPRYKSGVRPRSAQAQVMYTAASREIIEDIFAFELNEFGYSAPA